MPKCRLEFGVHSEIPATSQYYRSLRIVVLFLEQMLSWYPQLNLQLPASRASLLRFSWQQASTSDKLIDPFVVTRCVSLEVVNVLIAMTKSDNV
jgi:hypothetical protein